MTTLVVRPFVSSRSVPGEGFGEDENYFRGIYAGTRFFIQYYRDPFTIAEAQRSILRGRLIASEENEEGEYLVDSTSIKGKETAPRGSLAFQSETIRH